MMVENELLHNSEYNSTCTILSVITACLGFRCNHIFALSSVFLARTVISYFETAWICDLEIRHAIALLHDCMFCGLHVLWTCETNSGPSRWSMLLTSLEESCPLPNNQWGFWISLYRRSTIGALLSAAHDWFLELDNGNEVAAVFLDIKKAFDSVPHRLYTSG